MSLAEYISNVAGNSIGRVPRTLQDVVARRVTLDAYAADTTQDTQFTPRVVWRLAWLSLRQVQLIPSLLPDPLVTVACNRYSEHLMKFAGRLNAKHSPDLPQSQILTQYFAESTEFWTSLAKQLDRIAAEPLEWIERDVATLMWIRLCTFYVCATVTERGRPRSRREIANVLADGLTQFGSPTSIRLRIAPAIEHDLQLADRWARFCGMRCGAAGVAMAIGPRGSAAL